MEGQAPPPPPAAAQSLQSQAQQQPPSVPNPNFRQAPAWAGSPQYHHMTQSSTAQQPSPAAFSILRHSSPNTLPTLPQNFQGHGILRGSTISWPTTASTLTTSTSSHHQPWLAQSGRPPVSSPSALPSPSQSPFRPSVPSPSALPSSSQSSFRSPVPVTMHQRSHIPQQPQALPQMQPQPIPPTSQPQQLLSSSQQQQQQQEQQQQHQQHFPQSINSHGNYGQPQSQISQPVSNQQQIARVQATGNQRPPTAVMGQPTIVHLASIDKALSEDPPESCDRILSKRSIQELLNQVDPSEKLDPDVEDVLVDIADDFIDSVTTFGCSLAKHRKSSTLEAKDILLHLERTWNMTLPGFSGDEIKTYKKPVVNDIHKERLAVIKKSLTVAELNKSSSGQAAGNVKGHLGKA